MSQDLTVRDLSTATRRRAVIAACIGNFIEYYDFVIYGYFAAVIAKLFFPASNETVSLLLTFAAFALSYVARPVGAVLFGMIGDKYGRRAPLTMAILLIACCTAVIGLMPTYESIGIAAPIVLTLARLLQGVSVGGEYGGALAFIAEYAPERRRGLYTAWQTVTIGLALIVGASVAAGLTGALSTEALEAWGWRAPFLIGLPLGFIGLYMRLKLEETPHFQAVQERMEVEKAPLRTGVKQAWRQILICCGIMATPSLCIYIYFIYSPTYLSTELGYSAAAGQQINLIGLLFYCALVPVFAVLCDRIGRRPVLLAGALGVAVVTYPGFVALGANNAVVATLALCVMGLAFAPISAASLVALAESFPTTFRYTGVSLSLQITVTALGGTAPLLATALIAGTGDVRSPALLVVAGGILSAVAAWAYRETVGQGLRQHVDDHPAQERVDTPAATPIH
ncbi:MAG TPA: MFS transporter [Nocardioidaceae bacterium]|nr:MFS transporter [Nocardioidaceae bacterium]